MNAFANTHHDHTQDDAVRVVQAGYLIDNLADKIAQYPFMITGGFVSDHYGILTEFKIK